MGDQALSTSNGDTQMPDTLNMSSLRPQKRIAPVGVANVFVAGAGPMALEVWRLFACADSS